MNTLFLYTEEAEAYAACSSDIQSGWKVEDEKYTAADSFEKRKVRMQLMHLRDPKLKVFLDHAAKCSAPKEVAEHLHNTDLTHIDTADLAELFFALGPTVLTLLINFMLKDITSDEEVEGVAALTLIRHKLLEAFQS